MHARLGCWILQQNCKNTLPWHTVHQKVRSAQNEKLLWLAGMSCVEIQTHCKAQHLMVQHGEMRISILKIKLKMDASQTVKE